MPTWDAQRTRLELDGNDVVVIDTFGVLSDLQRQTIELHAKRFFRVALATDAKIALIQFGPEPNVRPVHA